MVLFISGIVIFIGGFESDERNNSLEDPQYAQTGGPSLYVSVSCN